MPKVVYMRRMGSGLVPSGAADEEIVQSLPRFTIIEVAVKRPRSGTRLAAYWAFAQDVATIMSAMGAEVDRDDVSERLKIGQGLCELVPLGPVQRKLTGERYAVRTKSISFDKMDEETFIRFLDRCCAFAAVSLIPHFPASQLKAKLTRHLRHYGFIRDDAA